MPEPVAAASDAASARVAATLPPGCVVVLCLCLVLFFVTLLARLGHPLLWQDEGETAMFGRRVLEHGVPKVHGDEGVVYGMSVPMAFAVDAESDAYTGSLWGQYYVAALAVALSDLAEEDHARTALLRLPFALAGSLGLWLLWRAHAPCFGDRRRRVGYACAWLVGLSASVSLLLHLREVRYYALVVLGVGAVVWLQRRAQAAPRALGTTLSLVALFHVFYPAAVSVGAWLALEALLPLRHRAARGAEAWRGLAMAWAPLVAAALLVVPAVIGFGMIPLSELMSARYRFGPADYVANLFVVIRYLAQHELLLAAALLRIAAWQLGGRVARPEAALALWRLALIWILVGARNPIFFERYFTVLGPLLLMAALLDFECVRRALEASVPDAARRTRALGTVAAVVVIGSLAVKAPELAGRAREITTPVEGPLDVAIPWVRARFEGGPAPIVATNYESEVWMFYLGSTVVGRFHAAGEASARAEAAVRPDVVVPRRGYPDKAERLRVYLEPGAFERHALEIADLPYNTIPELSRGRVVSVTHPYETVRPDHPGEALTIWVRRDRGDGA